MNESTKNFKKEESRLDKRNTLFQRRKVLFNLHLLVIYFSEKSRQLNSRVMKLNTTAYTEWKNDHKTLESSFQALPESTMTIIKLLLMNELILVINIDLQFAQLHVLQQL